MDTVLPFEVIELQEAMEHHHQQTSENLSAINERLNNMDENAAQQNTEQLEELMAQASQQSNAIKRRITTLASRGAPGENGRIRAEQVRPCSSDSMYAKG